MIIVECPSCRKPTHKFDIVEENHGHGITEHLLESFGSDCDCVLTEEQEDQVWQEAEDEHAF